jgi:hypothetical protein
MPYRRGHLGQLVSARGPRAVDFRGAPLPILVGPGMGWDSSWHYSGTNPTTYYLESPYPRGSVWSLYTGVPVKFEMGTAPRTFFQQSPSRIYTLTDKILSGTYTITELLACMSPLVGKLVRTGTQEDLEFIELQ